jgi:hypothetical protein
MNELNEFELVRGWIVEQMKECILVKSLIILMGIHMCELAAGFFGPLRPPPGSHGVQILGDQDLQSY